MRGCKISEVLLIVVANVTYIAVMWAREVSEIVEDKIPEAWGYGGIGSAVLGSAAAATGVEVAALRSCLGRLCGVWCVTEADRILTQPEGPNKKIQ